MPEEKAEKRLWPPLFTLSPLKPGEPLINDTNHRHAPENIVVGEGTRMDSIMAFNQFRSKLDVGLRIGSQCTFVAVQFAVAEKAVIEIGDRCYIDGAAIIAEERITIGNRVIISMQATIADSDFHPIDPELRARDAIALAPGGDGNRPPFVNRPVIIEDDVFIGFGATILKGVHIGQGATIEPGSVVTKSVPAGATIGGNPARILKIMEAAGNN